MPATIVHRGHVAALIAAWGLALAAGMALMASYAARPGDPGAPPIRRPTDAAALHDDRRPTLLIFLHPRCPCSRASLAELAKLLDRCGDRVAARAVVYQPRGDRDGWFPADLRAALEAIPRLAVSLDVGGDEAGRFGVATSGHVLLYSPRGDLMFSGGITPGRGEQGDNLGRAQLLGRIMDTAGDRREHPVFGCSLATPRPAKDAG